MEVNVPLVINDAGESESTFFEKSHCKSSNFKAGINILKSSIGIGILALPYCFFKTGLLLSLIVLCIIALLTIYTVYLITRLAEVKDLKETNFSELYKDYVSKWSLAYFQISMAILYFGSGVSYVIFFIDFFINAFGTPHEIFYSMIFSLVSLVIILPLSFIRKLEFFANYSFISNTLMIGAYVFILYYPITHVNPENLNNLANFQNLSGLLGVALFAYVSPGLIIPIRNSMEKKEEFPKVFSSVLLIVLLIYSLFAFVCCLGFTNAQLTQNILEGFGSINQTFLWIQGLYALALVLSYPLQLQALFEVLESVPRVKIFLKMNESNWLKKNSVRILVSLFIFPLGIFIRKFADFINLLGALCYFVIQFIFPCWAYNVCFQKEIKWQQRYFHYFLILFSVAGFTITTYDSFVQLITNF